MPSSKTFASYSLSSELQSSFRRSWRMFLSLMGASEADSTSSDLNRLCHYRKSVALTDPSCDRRRRQTPRNLGKNLKLSRSAPWTNCWLVRIIWAYVRPSSSLGKKLRLRVSNQLQKARTKFS